MILKYYHLLIALLTGATIMYFVMKSKGRETGVIKTGKEVLKQDNQKLINLTVFDSAYSRQLRWLRDTINQHRREIAYWRAKYHTSIQPTKAQIKEVFKQDTVTIVREVIKGQQCDTLQRIQGLQIATLWEANKVLDSICTERNKRLLIMTQMDSIHFKIESALTKKARNRIIAEIGLGIIAVLALIFR